MMLMSLMLLAAAAEEPEFDCDNPQYQIEMNHCAYRDYEAADAALNVQWKLTSAKMKQIDAEFDGTYDNRPGYHDTLLAAQRAWLTYRDRYCESEGYSMRGGSAESMVISGCRATLTRERTEQLKALVEEY